VERTIHEERALDLSLDLRQRARRRITDPERVDLAQPLFELVLTRLHFAEG
jgi:hypothetical protein